jgi:fibronectin type 3 domain-containing protein
MIDGRVCRGLMKNNGTVVFLFALAVCSCVTQNGPGVFDIPTPAIDTVSQGLFTDCIRIDWRTDTVGIARFQIYRSSAEDGAYEPIALVDAAVSINYFRDSVKTTAVYYYKIAAIDSNGRSSRLSPGKHGFSRTIPEPPVLWLQEHADFVALAWPEYRGAAGYAVFRSAEGCTTGMVRVVGTSLTAYIDSTASLDLSFYRLAALDSAGRTTAVSSCVWGRLQKLPAPTGVKISNDPAPHSLLLQWDSVSGSREYVIYRSSGYCPDADQEYARTKSTFFSDTVKSAGYYYYAVAAVNRAARVSAMSVCVRGAAVLLAPPDSVRASCDEYPGAVVLSWKALAHAHHYVLYRALGGCSREMKKIDGGTPVPMYTDSVSTSDTFGYIVAGVDSAGIEGLPSACVAGRVKLLPAPANIRASNGLYTDKIRISWDPVNGADGYICYRGESNVSSSAIPVDTVTSLFEFDSVSLPALYYYWVEARDRLGPGKRGGYVWGRTFLPPQIIGSEALDDSTFIFSWVTDTSSIKWKFIYRFSGDDESPKLFDSTMISSYTCILHDYASHEFSVLAKTSIGDSAFTYPVSLARCPPAPTGLTATGAEDCVYLHWNPIPGISLYGVLRSDTIADSTEFLDYPLDTFYVDYSATRAHHCYQVIALPSNCDIKPSEKVVAGIINPPGRRRE